MKPILCVLVAFSFFSAAHAQETKDIPYAGQADKLRTLDIYAPANAKNLPVVFWIHGGGWQAGDKDDVKLKPQMFMDKGFVFVSTNYRLWPNVEMGALIRDTAQSFKWVHDHIAEYGGDPKRVLVGGHSAGAQLAAILCTDEKYLKEQGIGFDVLIGCIPVDGDTYDIPAIIEVAETRWRVHHLPPPKATHRIKFGTPEQHRDFSAVYHVEKGKGIPPFLLMYVTNTADTTAQAMRFGTVLKEADVKTTLYGGKETTHDKLNNDIGLADDPGTAAVNAFIAEILKK